MSVIKPHREFHAVDMAAGWRRAPLQVRALALLLEIHHFAE